MIESVVSLANGFLVAQGSSFFIYRTSRVDDRAPLKLHGEKCTLTINNEPSHQGGTNLIESMCINSKENYVYVITNHGQMIGGHLDTKSASGPPYTSTFDYVQGLFHKNEITGLDVCIRKQLIVTCSRDKTVNIWDYHNRTLEIQTMFPEECLSVAFHPSGLHLVVAMQDKIQMCNVLSKSIVSFKSHPIKACTEIRFSHGGNMFACVAN
jgi:WD40 repeat protein